MVDKSRGAFFSTKDPKKQANYPRVFHRKYWVKKLKIAYIKPLLELIHRSTKAITNHKYLIK